MISLPRNPGDALRDKKKIMFHGESCRFDILPDETVCAEQGMCNKYRHRFGSKLGQGS